MHKSFTTKWYKSSLQTDNGLDFQSPPNFLFYSTEGSSWDSMVGYEKYSADDSKMFDLFYHHL